MISVKLLTDLKGYTRGTLLLGHIDDFTKKVITPTSP